MPTRNPALSSQIVGKVNLRYKDVLESMTYSVDVSALLADNEEVDPLTIVVTVAPDDPQLDYSYIGDSSSVTVYIEEGGTIHKTYEFTIQFDSNLGNPYVDYMRCNVKQVYKEC